MELKEYLNMIVKNKLIIFIIIIFSCLLTYYFTITKKVSYDGSLYVNAIVASQNLENEYDYDNYYSLKASESFLDIVIGWLKDPANIASIYAKTNEIFPQEKISKYSNIITSKKINPTTMQILISGESENYVKNILSSIKVFINDKSLIYSQNEYVKNANVVTGDIFVTKNIPNLYLNLIIAFFVGIFISIIFILFKGYMNKK